MILLINFVFLNFNECIKEFICSFYLYFFLKILMHRSRLTIGILGVMPVLISQLEVLLQSIMGASYMLLKVVHLYPTQQAITCFMPMEVKSGIRASIICKMEIQSKVIIIQHNLQL